MACVLISSAALATERGFAQDSYGAAQALVRTPSAQCGGWDKELLLGTTPGPDSFVAGVTGVPGRKGIPLGNIQSGMAERDESGGLAMIDPIGVIEGVENGYTYPTDTTSVCGFRTYCRTPSHPRMRTNGGGLQRDTPPFFCDFASNDFAAACQRPLFGPPDDGKPVGWTMDKVTDSIKCGQQQPRKPEDKVKYACGGGETVNTSPEFCQNLANDGEDGGLCQDLDNWVYILWRKKVHTCHIDNAGTTEEVPIYRYEKGPCGFRKELPDLPHNDTLCADGYEAIEIRECCNDFIVVDGTPGASRTQTGTDPTTGDPTYTCDGVDATFIEDYGGTSCKTCFGDECRGYTDPLNVIIPDVWFDPHPGHIPETPGQCLDSSLTIDSWPIKPDDFYRLRYESHSMISYFREYSAATYERKKMEKNSRGDDLVPDDDHKKTFPVACYGMYDMAPEDAKLVKTETFQKRCVMAAYYDDPMHFRDMEDTQIGKADLNDEDDDILRGLDPFNDGKRPWDKDTSLWYPELSNAFSVINEEEYEERFKTRSDLTFALLGPDNSMQRATVQLDESRRLSSGSVLRAFDDTVTNDEDPRRDRRTVMEWWQHLSTEMHKVFSPPTVRILLPATWSVDLDPLDPLFTPLPATPPDVRDPRMNPIEVQVRADEDLVGNLIAFFERALLIRVEERPIKLIVPIADPIELRSLAQGWYSWADKQEFFGGPGVSAARDSGDKLNEYADYIDSVRELRAELPRYAAEILKQQRLITETIAGWMHDNVEKFDEYKDFNEELDNLKPQWQAAEFNFEGLEKVSFPWCKNDRFTTPIYSLNDPWLPGRDCDADLSGGLKCTTGTGTGYLAMKLKYDDCIKRVENTKPTEPHGEADWNGYPEEICAKYTTPPPRMPFYSTVESGSLVIDLSAFREPQQPVVFPLLKNPVQIRLKLEEIRPPGLEKTDEPKKYPVDLPDLPELVTVWNEVKGTFPGVKKILDAGVLGDPEILLPAAVNHSETLKVQTALSGAVFITTEMKNEYERFWNSITKEEFKAEEKGREQDCPKLHDDTCVHFEADLLERITRIGARPAVFVKEDFESHGQFRSPWVHGHDYCDPKDWTCSPLQNQGELSREGWQLEFTDDSTGDGLTDDLRKRVREETDNVDNASGEEFFYDINMDEIFTNFSTENEIEINERFPETVTPFPPQSP